MLSWKLVAMSLVSAANPIGHVMEASIETNGFVMAHCEAIRVLGWWLVRYGYGREADEL